MNCVYRIECLDKNITDFYIGSTDDLKSRIISHKSSCYNTNTVKYNYKVYKFIRDNGGWDNWKVIVEYETPNYTEEQRIIEEQLNKDLLKPTLNSKNAVGIDIERKQITQKNHNDINNKIKANCPICGIEILKNNIKRHLKLIHYFNIDDY